MAKQTRRQFICSAVGVGTFTLAGCSSDSEREDAAQNTQQNTETVTQAQTQAVAEPPSEETNYLATTGTRTVKGWDQMQIRNGDTSTKAGSDALARTLNEHNVGVQADTRAWPDGHIGLDFTTHTTDTDKLSVEFAKIGGAYAAGIENGYQYGAVWVDVYDRDGKAGDFHIERKWAENYIDGTWTANQYINSFGNTLSQITVTPFE